MNFRAKFSTLTGWLGRFSLCSLLTVILTAGLVAGCNKSGSGDGTQLDPEMTARLAGLTKQLHHTMLGRKINRDFDEFVALSNVEVLPPPAGKKYAISEHWKVILVDK